MPSANPSRGYALGIAAYLIWGLFPLYFKAIQAVPALEIIAHRAIWSALFGALLLALWKHPGWWRELRDNPKRLAVLTASGLLIASNWLVYVWAVNNGRMLEASLGYYINPLINVLLGMLLLGERLRRLQWVAVGLATLGVLQQLWQVGSLPWVSLVLALTFGFYGLIRKQAPVAGSLFEGLSEAQFATVTFQIKSVRDAYDLKVSLENPGALASVERYTVLSAIDRLWQEHLYAMDSLRGHIGLRQYGQRDPLIEYKVEAFKLFDELMVNIKSETCSNIFRSASSLMAFEQFFHSLPQVTVHQTASAFSEMAAQEQAAKEAGGALVSEANETLSKAQPVRAALPRVGRNDPCPCGSGKKFKSCHGR